MEETEEREGETMGVEVTMGARGIWVVVGGSGREVMREVVMGGNRREVMREVVVGGSGTHEDTFTTYDSPFPHHTKAQCPTRKKYMDGEEYPNKSFTADNKIPNTWHQKSHS